MDQPPAIATLAPAVARQRYPGVVKLYEALSESAHPNYEGTIIGYSDVDRDKDVTTFTNEWEAMYGGRHLEAIDACAVLFHGEYNDEWSDACEQLEQWISTNDEHLEATKPSA